MQDVWSLDALNRRQGCDIVCAMLRELGMWI
jgi:hypothetical protein